MTDAICLGELLVDFVPTESGKDLIEASTFRKAAGGAPANVAVGLKRLGISSGFMGKVGVDPFGRFLAHTLEAHGVDVSTLRHTRDAPTALAFVSLRADGERDFVFFGNPSADKMLTSADIDLSAIARAKLLHFGSISLSMEPARTATIYAADAAQEAGALISYDPNLRLSFWADADAARQGIRAGLAKADVVKISEDELNFLTGANDPARARDLLWTERMKLMVVTSGRAGSVYITNDFIGAVPSFRVKSVDATGAGDAFTAGLLAGLLKQRKAIRNESMLKDVVRFANAVGALTTTARGAIPSLPTRQQVEEFLGTGSAVPTS
jgi:fructokinase